MSTDKMREDGGHDLSVAYYSGYFDGKRAAEALAARSTPPAEWRPIEEAPRNRAVLMWGTYWNGRDTFQRPMVGGWNPHDDRWVIYGEMRFGVRPTHWMELPPPPPVAKEPT